MINPATDAAKPSRAGLRLQLPQATVRAAQKAGVLVIDEARTRPRYRDGQLLGATGFRRDQQLFLRRQRDIARIVDRGVVEGLEVEQLQLLDDRSIETEDLDPLRFRIEPGHGVTADGETIVLRERVEIDLAQLPTFELLDGSFELDRNPRPPARTQSGIFAVALRRVEYTANPVAPYPKSITGDRQLEDGDTIEATLVTLIPILSESNLDGIDAGPAALARRIFVEHLDPLPQADALPVAVVAIERGRIAWLDADLGRREALADPDQGLGATPRPDREAHVRHFSGRMAEILDRRADDGLSPRFAASDYFEVLPPTGALPTATVSTTGDNLVQWFFPPNIECEMAIVPDDELAELRAEAMLLEPIDLTETAGNLEAAPILIAIPVSRSELGEYAFASGAGLRHHIGARIGSYARRKPVEALIRRSLAPTYGDDAPLPPNLEAWSRALATAHSLYFFRQRRRARDAFALPRYGPVPIEQRPSGTLAPLLRARLEAAGELERFDRLLIRAPSEALDRIEVVLSTPNFGSELLLVNALVAELSARARRRILDPGTVTVGASALAVAGVPAGAPAALRLRPLSLDDVNKVAARYTEDPGLGAGLAILRSHESQLNDLEHRLVVAQSLRVPALDERTQDRPAGAQAELARRLVELAIANDVSGIRDLVGYVRPKPPPLETPRRDDGQLAQAFEQSFALDQGAVFALLWQLANDDMRQLIDDLFATPLSRLPLSSGPLLIGLVEFAWQVRLETVPDVDLFLERMYRWPFSPNREFDLPLVVTGPRHPIRLDTKDLAISIDDIREAEATLQNETNTGSRLDFPATQQAFEDQVLPVPGVEDIEVYRILGLAFSDLELFIQAATVLKKRSKAEFTEYALELRNAIAAREIAGLRGIYSKWRSILLS